MAATVSLKMVLCVHMPQNHDVMCTHDHVMILEMMFCSFMCTHTISGYDSMVPCVHIDRNLLSSVLMSCYELKNAILSSHESSQRGEVVQNFFFILYG